VLCGHCLTVNSLAARPRVIFLVANVSPLIDVKDMARAIEWAATRTKEERERGNAEAQINLDLLLEKKFFIPIILQ